jgi:hypothetical protein
MKAPAIGAFAFASAGGLSLWKILWISPGKAKKKG